MNYPFPDLVICIPTFNRAKNLKALLDSFVLPLLSQYESRIQVVVADNSDADLQLINASNISNHHQIAYHANVTNLGYGGNIVSLLKLARPLGRYLWFCSDDDELNLEAFHLLMSLLQDDKQDDVALYTFTHSYSGDKPCHVSLPLTLSQENFITFDNIIKKCEKVIPFLLLSSYAIKTQYITADVLSQMTAYANDFAHISLLGLALPQNALVCTTKLPLIIYNTEGSPGIEVGSVFKGYAESLDTFSFLSAADKTRMNKTFLRGMLYLVLRFRGNPRSDVQKVFSPFTSSYRRLAYYLFQYPTIRGVILFLVAFLPNQAIKPLLAVNQLRLKTIYSSPGN